MAQARSRGQAQWPTSRTVRLPERVMAAEFRATAPNGRGRAPRPQRRLPPRRSKSESWKQSVLICAESLMKVIRSA
jgi:hypothetical protein